MSGYAHVRNGSKAEKLTARIYFPLGPSERTSRAAVSMSVSCQKAGVAAVTRVLC
jgi:hypothetical protein